MNTAALRLKFGALALVGLLGVVAGCGDDKKTLPPVFSSLPGESTVSVGEALDLTITATDPEGALIKLSMPEAPAGAEFIAPGGLGRFHWAPLVSDVGTHDVVFVASDGEGGESSLRVQVIVEASDGAPRFITPPQRILDLGLADTLLVEVRVKDDDSAQVGLTIEDAPKGMELFQSDAKSGELTWTPTPDQIGAQSVFTASLVADDGSGGRTTQVLSVILITKEDEGCGQGDEGMCSCAPPIIAHQELGDQRGLEDYGVAATIADNETKVVSGTLFYTTGDPADLSQFDSVEMTQNGDSFDAAIPNPLLDPGQTATFFYMICAADNDDPDGDTCDNIICSPEEGRYSFTAFAVGDEDNCREDEREPDNGVGAAKPLTEDVVSNLTICPGDTDVHAIEAPAGANLSVLIAYTAANGNLGLRLIDADGQTVLAEEDTRDDDDLINILNLPEDGTYFVEVFGEPNSYDIFAVVETPSTECTDMFEPNEDFESAPQVAPGRYNNLSICGGDKDVYGIRVEQGQVLTVAIRFSHEVGDLDMSLYAPGGGSVISRARSVTDDEEIVARQFPNGGTALLEVEGFQRGTNNYDLEVSVEAIDDACRPDSSEPNDSPNDATPIRDGDDLNQTLCPGEEDWFSIALDQGERVQVQIDFDGETTDLDLALIDGDAATELDISDGIEDTEILTYSAELAGLHFFKVFGFEGDSGPYTLTARNCEGDESEPNDSPEDATTIVPGVFTRSICLGEEDWFGFDVGPEGAVLMDMTSTDPDALEVALHRADTLALVAVSEIVDGSHQLLVDELAEGGYVLVVRGTDPSITEVLYEMTFDRD